MHNLEALRNIEGTNHMQILGKPIRIYSEDQPSEPLGQIDDPVSTLLQAIYEISVSGIPPLLKEKQMEAFRKRLYKAALNVRKTKGYYTDDVLNASNLGCVVDTRVDYEQAIIYKGWKYSPSELLVESPYFPSQRIKLTYLEGRLFEILLRNGGHTIPNSRVEDFVHGIDGGGGSFRTHAAHIRTKIGDKENITGYSHPIHLIYVNQTGYMFQDTEASA